MSGFEDTGRMQRAASMVLRRTMTAPSWRGEFLKNSDSRRGAEAVASMVSPVAMKSSSSFCRLKMMRAPVFDWDMCMQAWM